jgi:molecular chaperone HscB
VTVNPFATLGLEPTFELDLAAAEKTHRELSRALHPDRFVDAGASERRAALTRAIEVNEAWRVVRDPIRRAEALLELSGVPTGEEGARRPAVDPEFLMEMLEQREALAEAKQARDLAGVHALAAAIEARARSAEGALGMGFARGEFAGGEAASLVGKLSELRFYRRFLDEVSAIEDELAA